MSEFYILRFLRYVEEMIRQDLKIEGTKTYVVRYNTEVIYP